MTDERRFLERVRSLPRDEQAAALSALTSSGDAEIVRSVLDLALGLMRSEPVVRVIAATAQDRLRVLAGQPQKFGTQSHVVDGVRQLWPVDAWTTDSERAKWGLPSLAALRAAAEDAS